MSTLAQFHHTFVAAKTKPAPYTLLLLHGTGGNENDLLDIGRRFGANVHLLSPRGRVLENGMPRFFRRVAMGVFDVEDMKARTTELVDFVREAAAHYDFDAKKVVALGYSNGANIAGSTLLMYPDFLAGAILFRPMIPFLTDEPVQLPGTPVFISVGKMDQTLPPGESENWRNILTQSGSAVTFQVLPTGHNLTQTDIDSSVQWFAEAFDKKTPGK